MTEIENSKLIFGISTPEPPWPKFEKKLKYQKSLNSCAEYFSYNTCADFWHACAKGLETTPWKQIVVKLIWPTCRQGKKWSSTCQFVFISGPLPVKRLPKKKIRKIFIAPKVSSWNFRGSLLSYFWAITFISAVIAILDTFGTLVPRISATVKQIENLLFNGELFSKWVLE